MCFNANPNNVRNRIFLLTSGKSSQFALKKFCHHLTNLVVKGPLQPKIFISEHDVIRPPENESVIIFFIPLTVL